MSLRLAGLGGGRVGEGIVFSGVKFSFVANIFS